MSREQRANKALEEIKAMDATVITPSEVAPVLGVDAQSIRKQAEEDPRMLGFRVSRIGGRTVIPRLAFIAWVEGVGA